MPGFHHAMFGAFGGDGEAIKLARQTHREVTDVDHLLHFAQTFLQNFSGFDGHQLAKRLLVSAQFVAEQTHEFATCRRGHGAPGEEGFATLR